MAIPHALIIGNKLPGTNDREFSSPYNLCGSEHRSVYFGLGVPVSGDQKHVSTDVDSRFVDAEGCAGPGVMTLHVNVAEVRRRFIDGDIRVELDDLSTSPQQPKVIAFDEGPGLVLCVSHVTMKENIRETYRATLWSGLY